MNLSVRPSHSQEKQHSQEGEEKFPTAFTLPVSFQPLFPASLLHSQELMSSPSLQHSPPTLLPLPNSPLTPPGLRTPYSAQQHTSLSWWLVTRGAGRNDKEGK